MELAGPPASTGQPVPRPASAEPAGYPEPWPAYGRPPAEPAGYPGAPAGYPESWSGYGRPPTPPAGRQSRTGWRRVLAPLAAVGAFVAKYGVLLAKLKVLAVVGSMLVSVAAYAWLFGWQFGAGLVALIFVHELGHVFELRRQRVPASLPVFVPFLGAFVRMKSTPRDVGSEAASALAGPALGTVGALGCWLAADATGSSLLRVLAYTGFLINLFNLLPALPLDGGRVAGAVHPAIWLAGLLALLGWEVVRPSPVIPIVLLLGGAELWRRWRGRRSPAARRYHDISIGQRAAIGTGYLGLVVLLLVCMHATYLQRHF
jgi:Zn-dependent protease